MSKVASYLRGHLSGEVVTRSDVVNAMSNDNGILSIKPEMVVYPRTTNDVRKVVRFAWQLSEKGHVLPVTVRGAGTDATGAAIGKGIALVTSSHLNKVFEYDPKQHLVRLQPGASVASIDQALALYGDTIPSLFGSRGVGTVAGAVSSGAAGPMAGKYGSIQQAVEQLEVVLANGDLLQTGRISKRELNKRKGVQGFVGDIYRGIDAIIEENADLLDSLRSDDSTGYNSIADVRQTDGSFDLTPLFVGAQGTLGIISEMIMKTESKAYHYAIGAFVYESTEAARDSFDELCRLDPALIDYFDASFFDSAASHGKHYEFYQKAAESFKPAAVVLIGFDDTSDRQRAKHLKKLRKIAEKSETYLATADAGEAEEMLSAYSVVHYLRHPDVGESSAPDIFSGFQVPGDRFEEFYTALQALSTKLHIALPLTGHVYTGVYSVYPTFDLKKVGDKQAVFKVMDELSQLIIKNGGAVVSEGVEGRLKATFIYPHIDERLVKMYQDIKHICDPKGLLNPGVKQKNEIRSLAEMVRSTHDAGQFARFGL